MLNMFKRILSIAWAVMSVSALFGQASYRATFYVDGAKEKEQNRSHTSLESVEPNASVVYATGGVELFLSHMRLNKTSGSISDATHRETGHNSVVLADDGSRVWMDFCEGTGSPIASSALEILGATSGGAVNASIKSTTASGAGVSFVVTGNNSVSVWITGTDSTGSKGRNTTIGWNSPIVVK